MSTESMNSDRYQNVRGIERGVGRVLVQDAPFAASRKLDVFLALNFELIKLDGEAVCCVTQVDVSS